MIPTKKGVAMTLQEWDDLKNYIDEVEAQIDYLKDEKRDEKSDEKRCKDEKRDEKRYKDEKYRDEKEPNEERYKYERTSGSKARQWTDVEPLLKKIRKSTPYQKLQ